MAHSPRAPLTKPAWRRIPERGTALGIRIVVGLSALAGRAGAGVLLTMLAYYYTLMHRTARLASRAYFERLGFAPTFASTVKHVRFFAQVSLDRLYFLRGRFEGFAIERHGHEHIMNLTKSKRGALLLGSHLGSFEAMRAVALDFAVPLNIVADFKNAEHMNGVLAELAPGIGVRLIALDPRSPGSVLAIRDCIERGELVAILGDRTSPSDARNVLVQFFGAEASLPGGPYLLAHVLKCPVYLVFCLYEEPNKYTLHCEPFAEEVRLDRKNRDASIREYAQKYADRLEHYAKLAPYNWFNFFPFWTGEP